jgi:hypothetical protein
VENFATQFEKSMMLRYLIHILGDIHQPLHASTLFDNNKFIHGDQGGNFFYIKYKDGIDQLHKLLDSGMDLLDNEVSRPLSEKSNLYLKNISSLFMDELPRSHFHHSLFTPYSNFSDWVQESHDLANSWVYPNIDYKGAPSEEYINSGYKYIKQRITLAGYRLADLIKEFYTSFKKPAANEPMKPNRDHTKTLNFLD